MRRCQWCKEGVAAMDGENRYVQCALTPPTPILETVIEPSSQNWQRLIWVRPSMALKGWCGQFRFSLVRFLGYGPRA